MLIIKHRVNKIEDLIKTPYKYGVEIDLRSNLKREIYLHHDPFKKGELFKKWLKYFKHNLIVLNVKEEGMENEIMKIIKKQKLKNFFFHDQTFSSLLKNMSKTNVSIRYSEYEELKKKKILFKKIKWLWLDNFSQVKINQKFYNFLKRNKVKICLVSPELVNKKRKKEIKLTYNKLVNNNITPDAICTKFPRIWETIKKKNEIKYK